MIYRSLHMIFESSGQPVPTEEEVQYEAREIVQRSGWGLPLIEALRKVRDPYWREAITRCLMAQWNEMVRDKDEQTYYYDMDGDIRFCWSDAESDFGRIIRHSASEQVDYEQRPIPVPSLQGRELARKAHAQIIYNITIQQNNGQINLIEKSNVSIYPK